jgi:hypothetical protein
VHYENFTHSPSNGFDLDTAWARYQLGEPSLAGLVESNLLVYRDAMTDAQAPMDLNLSQILTGTLTAHGWRGSATLLEDRKLNRDNAADLFTALDTLDLDGYRADLDALLAMDTQGTQLVLVDMPLPVITMRVLERYDHEGYLNTINTAAVAHNVPMIAAPPPEMIPISGYQDHSHMNAAGATGFSAWLGKVFGQVQP